MILRIVNNFNFLIWNGIWCITNCKHVSDKIRVLSLPSLFFQRKCNGYWRLKGDRFHKYTGWNNLYIFKVSYTATRMVGTRDRWFRESVLSCLPQKIKSLATVPHVKSNGIRLISTLPRLIEKGTRFATRLKLFWFLLARKLFLSIRISLLCNFLYELI